MSSIISNHDDITTNEKDEHENSLSVGKRLEEELIIRLSADHDQEPHDELLSEELISINNQLQDDELLAMESIYGDNIFIVDNKSGLKCFQTHIFVEVPKGICITAKLNSLDSFEKTDDKDDDPTDFSYSFRVEHIPPIILTCLLPKSYPSNHAPYFSISVQWLSTSKISDLCSRLDSIWQEQAAGQEVIYQWVEWLHGCTLSHLGFDNEIVLGPYNGVMRSCSNVDRRAISRSVSPEIDIPLLKSYNTEKCNETFCKNIQECCICFSEFYGSEFIRLPCQHFFCMKCIKTFSDIHITEGTVMKLQCPESKCDGMIPPGLVKRLLGDDEEKFKRYEELTLQKTLESMPDVVHCPRCETLCLGDYGDADHAQCSRCYFSFCTLCNDRRHVGLECVSPEMRLLILMDRKGEKSLYDDLRRTARNRKKDYQNQMLSLNVIRKSSKQCPTCKMAITRTEGCNMMHCSNCGNSFCYRCNIAIQTYAHFSGGKCRVFS